MRRMFFKGIAIGAVMSAVALMATSALAGTGINDVFNLGVVNGVDGLSVLKGTTANDQLRVNNLAASDAAVAVHGLHSAATGNGAGVLGDSSSSSPTATGVSGRVTSAAAGDGSAAVRGVNNGNGWGVYGQTNGAGDYADGIYGVHPNGAGAGAGVRGETSSEVATATGVLGRVSSSDAAVGSAAVRGINNGKGIGVYGRNPNDVPFGYAVFGEGRYGVVGSALFSGASSGVYGTAAKGFAGVEGHSANGDGFGVYGRNSVDDNVTGLHGGAGVFGIHSAAGGTTPGVKAETNSSSPNATAILGRVNPTNPGRDAVAVRGINNTTNNLGMGVWGSVNGNGWGVLGEAGPTGTGVVGKVGGAGVGVHGDAGPGGIGVKGVGRNGQYVTGLAGQFIGEVDVQGYLRLPIRESFPPSSDCLYANHRGRMFFVPSENAQTLFLFVCTATGWKSVTLD